jgi:hypothetical protein
MTHKRGDMAYMNQESGCYKKSNKLYLIPYSEHIPIHILFNYPIAIIGRSCTSRQGYNFGKVQALGKVIDMSVSTY